MACRYYVYKFYLKDVCVYVGKGSGNRFKVQSRRFKEYFGQIEVCFAKEQDALEYEIGEIIKFAPMLNKTHMPVVPEPWKVMILPANDKEFYAWCNAIGTRQMALRVLLSKDWLALKKLGFDAKSYLSKLDPWCERFNGCWT